MGKSKNINFFYFSHSNRIFMVVILILVGISFILYKTNSTINDQYANPWRIISTKFPGNDYRTQSIPLGDKQVFVIQHHSTLDPEYPTSKPPLVWAQDTDDIYEIVFTGENGTTGIWGHSFQSTDIDGDNREELISEWNLNWAGSGGYNGLIVWGYENGSIKPIAGYPEDFKSDRKILVKNLAGKVIAEYPVTDINYLTEVIHGGKLYFGWFVYDIQNESHTGPHFWKLKAYKYKHGKFEVDKNWNNGEELTTKEKYPLANTDELFQYFYPYFQP